MNTYLPCPSRAANALSEARLFPLAELTEKPCPRRGGLSQQEDSSSSAEEVLLLSALLLTLQIFFNSGYWHSKD